MYRHSTVALTVKIRPSQTDDGIPTVALHDEGADFVLTLSVDEARKLRDDLTAALENGDAMTTLCAADLTDAVMLCATTMNPPFPYAQFHGRDIATYANFDEAAQAYDAAPVTAHEIAVIVGDREGLYGHWVQHDGEWVDMMEVE
jgi:hypothetical protein